MFSCPSVSCTHCDRQLSTKYSYKKNRTLELSGPGPAQHCELTAGVGVPLALRMVIGQVLWGWHVIAFHPHFLCPF